LFGKFPVENRRREDVRVASSWIAALINIRRPGSIFCRDQTFSPRTLSKSPEVRIKTLIDRVTKTALISAFFWWICGVVFTQSARGALSFTASFVFRRDLTVRQGLPILFWGNTGRALFAIAG